MTHLSLSHSVPILMFHIDQVWACPWVCKLLGTSPCKLVFKGDFLRMSLYLAPPLYPIAGIMLMLWILIVSIRCGGVVVVLLAWADFELCAELVICVQSLARGRLKVLIYESNFHVERTACLFHLLFFWFLVEVLGNHFRCYFLHLFVCCYSCGSKDLSLSRFAFSCWFSYSMFCDRAFCLCS